jgi:signal peptidase I
MVVGTGPVPVQVGPWPDRPIVDPSRPRLRIAMGRGGLVVGLFLVLVIGGGATCAALGWSLRVVESPSMGRTAPVGTLVLSQRVDSGALRVGDVITYRPPGEGVTYTHRIVSAVPGGFRTRGDINGAPDAWTVTPPMIVGRAAALLPGLGTVLRLAPWIAIGMVLVWFATWPIRSARARSSARLVGASVVVTGTLLVLRPVAGYTMLTTAPTPRGLLATVVSTGLLPVRVSPSGGRSVELEPGEVARVLLPADPTGHVQLGSVLCLDAVGWCCFAVLCALPLIGVLVVGLPTDDAAAPA